MADQDVTVGASGTYSLPQTAFNAADVDTGYFHIGEIDGATYTDGNVTAGLPTGTATAANNVELAGTAGNRHDGERAGGFILEDGTDHVLTIEHQFVNIQDIELIQTTDVTSRECIRISANSEDLLVSRCILRHSAVTEQLDGIYGGPWDVVVHIDHCIFDGCKRGGTHAQAFENGPTHVWNIDACAFTNNATSAVTVCGGVLAFEQSTPDTADVTVTVYNTWSVNVNMTFPGDDYNAGGTAVTFAGSHNAAGDLSAEGKFTSSYDSVDVVDASPDTEDIHIFDVDGNDLRIASEGDETISQFGLDRVGSEPAPQTTGLVQDFSIDIGHLPRGDGDISIGPWQFVPPALQVPPGALHRRRRALMPILAM